MRQLFFGCQCRRIRFVTDSSFHFISLSIAYIDGTRIGRAKHMLVSKWSLGKFPTMLIRYIQLGRVSRGWSQIENTGLGGVCLGPDKVETGAAG